MLGRKIRDWLIIGASVIAVIVTAIVYSVFASEHIFNESREHLNEIYGQVSETFRQKVDNNRNLLHSWEQYIDNSVNDINSSDPEVSQARRAEFDNFMDVQIEKWKFSRFYFIGGEDYDATSDTDYKHIVDCKSVDGSTFRLRFRRSITELLDEEKCGVVGLSDDEDGELKEFILLGVEVNQNVYDGFPYHAIAISFASGDLMQLLDVKTFGNTGMCYIALPDGNVLIRSRENGRDIVNYLDFLKSDNCSISQKTADGIEKDWENGRSGTCLLETDDIEYYLTYMPTGFADWILVGVAPSDTVNDSLSWFRTVTIIVMVAIFTFAAVVIICMIVLNNKRRMKETLLEVKSRENLLDLLSFNTSDIFLMFSPDTLAAEYVSSNVKQVLGLDAESVRGDIRAILKASAEEHKPFTSEALKAIPDGNTWEQDIQMKNADTGESYWFRMTLYKSSDGGRDKCVLMFSDRTEETRMREQLEEALEIARNANEAKSNFLSNMSHDIRTPMNAIIGYATLLAKDADNGERVREYTRKISYSGQHLLSLINDILDMSKIESGKTSLYIEQFSLPEFIEELYSMIISQTNAKKQTFDVHTKGNIPELVMGDKMRLNQIMLNILSNAVKYTPAGGNISLRVETMKQQVHNHVHLSFTVEDNGLGMSPEFVKTIFEPFSRETNEKTSRIQGTGLGMAITKNIVDLMGGVISVESEQGKGSKFTVELELAVSEAIPDDEDFWIHHNVTNVLVVDDEEDVCMDIKELMADTGVKVDYALDGMAAVAKVEQAVKDKKDYNIVLLDWKMPGMDGLETARRIRAKFGRDLPIMVLTSYSFEDIEKEAREAGIDMFLSKPFFVSNFRRAIMQISADGADADIEPEREDVSIEGLKILAAEDNEINVEILLELLEIEGAECDVAVNGQDAVNKFEASDPGRYDVIFMDVQMPVMNGYEATRAIRASSHKDAKNIPIIAMTANAFDDDVKAALESGMNAHLAKPIDMTKLKQLIAKIRDGRHDG